MAVVLNQTWKPVDHVGWRRVAYGRKITHLSQGGTLRCLITDGRPIGAALLEVEVQGRALVQFFAQGRLLMDELVTNAHIEHFVPFNGLDQSRAIRAELHLIPATTADFKVPQTLCCLPETDRWLQGAMRVRPAAPKEQTPAKT